MYRIISLFVLCTLCVNSSYGGLTFDDCGSTVGKFTGVTVSGCDMTKTECDLVRETNVTISIDFTTEKSVSQVTSVCHGILMDVPIPFPLDHADACQDPQSGIQCPLAQGGPYSYKYSLHVQKVYPKLPVTVKWEIKDETEQNIVCVLIPARIK